MVCFMHQGFREEVRIVVRIKDKYICVLIPGMPEPGGGGGQEGQLHPPYSLAGEGGGGKGALSVYNCKLTSVTANLLQC